MNPIAVTVLLEFQYKKSGRLPGELVARFPITDYILGLPGQVPGKPILAWSYDQDVLPSTRAELAAQGVHFHPEDQIEEPSVPAVIQKKDALLLTGLKIQWEVTDRTRPLVAFFRLSRDNYDVVDSPALANLTPSKWTFVLKEEQQAAAQSAYRLIAVVEPGAPHVPTNVIASTVGLNCNNPSTIKTLDQMVSCVASRSLHHN